MELAVSFTVAALVANAGWWLGWPEYHVVAWALIAYGLTLLGIHQLTGG